MLRLVDRIPCGQLANQSRLFLDYVASPSEGVPPFLPSFAYDRDLWTAKGRTIAESVGSEERDRWTAVIDEVTARSKQLGARVEVLEKLSEARGRAAHFVVTGQQPGALGGPLHTAYKIATAVAVARDLEQQLGAPCVPLYWCGADDTDFQEIREAHVLTSQLSAVSASIAQEAHESGVPVGDIAVEPVSEMWQTLRGFFGELHGASRVAEVVERALDRANDHGELTMAILLGLFEGRFAVVDGRSAAVRQFAQPVFAEYVRYEDVFRSDVLETGRRLESSGYHAQLAPGEDSGVFLMEGGRRKNVSPQLRGRLADAVVNRVENCAPGVIVRNLIQDFTFRPLSVVLGPAEVAYRAQLSGLYERFGIVRPVELPRMGATMLPSAVAGLLGLEGGPDARTLLEDPASFAQTIYAITTPSPLLQSSEEFRRRVHRALKDLRAVAESQLPASSRGRIQSKLKDFGSRTDQTANALLEVGRVLALERWPFLAELAELIRPAGKPQERWLCSLVPFLFSNAGAGEDLIGFASTYLDELMDGRAAHILYSTGQ